LPVSVAEVGGVGNRPVPPQGPR